MQVDASHEGVPLTCPFFEVMAPGQYSTDAKQHTSLGWLGVLVLLLKLQFEISSKVGRSLEEVLQA